MATLIKYSTSVSFIVVILVLLDTEIQMKTAKGQTTSHFVRTGEDVVASPSYPSLYPPNQNRIWKFESHPGKRIVVVFDVFEVEPYVDCNYDYVLLSEGEWFPRTLGKFCGNKIPPPIISSSNEMTMIFHSDRSSEFKGFTATYSTKCVRSVKALQGDLASPNYPSKYPSNVKCSWEIETPPGYKIKLIFNTFNLEKCCRCDNVTLFDGVSETATSLGTFCGNETPDHVISTANKMLMVFQSDQSEEFVGFNATYTAVRFHTINTMEGVVISPEYPNKYPSNNESSWEFETIPEYKFKLVFNFFDVQPHPNCLHDFVELYDGNTINDPLLGKFCGRELPHPVISTAHRMLMIFHSDGSSTYNGFNATYNTIFNLKYVITDEIGRKISDYFLNIRDHTYSTYKWGTEITRTATALFLEDEKFFAVGNKTGEEIAYELSLKLMSTLVLKRRISTKELALFSNALTVACINPKEFFGLNIINELRKRVDNSNETNPFFILTLCNVGEEMKLEDVHKLQQLFHAHLRPSWTEVQAIVVMALECISRQAHRDLNISLTEMVSELKSKQQTNGTVENLKNTALVVQALIATEDYRTNFNMSLALKSILKAINHTNVGIEEMYYILPIFKWKTLLDINSNHCANTIQTDLKIRTLQNPSNGRIQVQVSIIIGNDMDFTRTWRIQVPLNYSFYQVLENISSSERDFKIQYIITKGKLYVSGLGTFQDSVADNSFWYIYTKPLTSTYEMKLVEESPVDVQVNESDELILWYRSGMNLNSTKEVSTNSTDTPS